MLVGAAVLLLVLLGAGVLRRQGSAHAGQHAVMSDAEHASAVDAMHGQRQAAIGVRVDGGGNGQAYELPDRGGFGRDDDDDIAL